MLHSYCAATPCSGSCSCSSSLHDPACPPSPAGLSPVLLLHPCRRKARTASRRGPKHQGAPASRPQPGNHAHMAMCSGEDRRAAPRDSQLQRHASQAAHPHAVGPARASGTGCCRKHTGGRRSRCRRLFSPCSGTPQSARSPANAIGSYAGLAEQRQRHGRAGRRAACRATQWRGTVRW